MLIRTVPKQGGGVANVYHNQSKYAEAEPLYQRALSIREQILDTMHPDLAQSLNNLAGLYYDQGKYEKTEPFLQRALVIREQVFGSEHAIVANSLYNLANLYYV